MMDSITHEAEKGQEDIPMDQGQVLGSVAAH